MSANEADLIDVGLIPRLGRSTGVRNGNPLQYSCLDNPMNRGACRATAHRVVHSQTLMQRPAQLYWCTFWKGSTWRARRSVICSCDTVDLLHVLGICFSIKEYMRFAAGGKQVSKVGRRSEFQEPGSGWGVGHGGCLPVAWMWTGSGGCQGVGTHSFQRTVFSQLWVLSPCAVSNSSPGHVPPEAPTASWEASQVAFLPTPTMASPRPCSLTELHPPWRSSVRPLWRKKAPRSGSPRNYCSWTLNP